MPYHSRECTGRRSRICGTITLCETLDKIELPWEFGDGTARAEAHAKSGAKRFPEIDTWLDRFRRFWEPKLDALNTEVARGKFRRN